MSEESKIIYRPDGSLSTLVGKDAVELMRVQTIIQGIKMHVRTNGRMQITRGFGIMKLLGMATQYTGQKYKRTEAEKAMADLNVWFQTMKSALPTETR